MKKFLTFLLIATVITSICRAQNPFELGAEYLRFIGKGYNTSKVAVRGESFSNKNSFSAGITYQLASAKAYSVSSGFGFYAGYRYAFGTNTNGNNIFAGARVLFSLEDFEGKTRQKSLLSTPMAAAGYHFIFAKRIYAAPSVGFGYTIEFSKGYNSLDEDVGKRFIPSLSAGYRF